MLRKLTLAACAGVLLLGVLVALGAFPKATETPKVAQKAPTPPRPARPPQAVLKQVVEDDTLPPPATDAPDSEWKAYEDAILAIKAGKDPLHEASRSKRESMQAQAMEAHKREMARRTEDRKKQADERHKQIEAHNAEKKAEHDKRRAESAAKRDPNAPKPEPLFPAPDLGPPVSGVKEPVKDPPKQ